MAPAAHAQEVAEPDTAADAAGTEQATDSATADAGTASAAQQDDGDIVVTGFRASLANALNIKRQENGVVDAISAEDIADFPDLNLAESLQRIPGVAITRRSGEGRQISVRGLGSDYTRVRVNGMEAIATSSGTSNSGGTNRGRGFDFNIFSSDLFSNLIVRKTASAEVDEGSLGATVDLNASKPFDSKGNKLVLSAQGSYNDLVKDVQPGLSFLGSWRSKDGRFGALLSASWDKRHLLEEGANITRWTYGGSNGGWNPASTVAGKTIAEINRTLTDTSDPETALYHPRIPAYASYDTSSERLGIAGALQFKPADSTLITVEGLFSRFEGARKESQLQALGLSRPGTGKPQSIIRSGIVEGNNLVQAEIDNVDLRTQSSYNELNTNFRQITGTIEQELGDRLRLRAMAGRSTSKYEDPVATIVTFERLNSQDFIYDFRPRMMEMTLNFDATSPDAWSMVPGTSEVRLTPEKVDNRFTTYKASGEFDLFDSVTLKAGADYKRFDYSTSALQRANTSVVPAIAAGPGIAALSRTFNFDQGLGLPSTAVQSWLAPDLDKFIAAYDIYSNTGIWALQENIGTTAEVTETTKGAYVQADFNFDAGGLPVRGDIGVRYFRTDLESSGNAVVGSGVTFVTVEHDYDDWLPSANLSVDVTPNLIARISAAKTIARPGIGSLSPGGSVTVQGANRNYSSGNPVLAPTKSTNLDLSIEWYRQAGAVLALGLFYKDIDTFVQTLRGEAVYSTLGLPDSLIAGTVATPDMVFAVTRPVNSPGGKLKGFEINLQQPLTFLPGFLSNFGVLANYTYVTSNIDYLTSTVPGARIVNATLIGLSKHAYNGTLYYEDSKFSARVSLAYRDGYLTAVPGNDFNSWHGTNATTNVDAQISYNLTDNIRLSLEGINLTDEYADLYVDADNRLNAYTHTGRQFVAGVRYTF
ncbi:TonB-dependent receptor [Sphingomonas parva]|uniref:TonB-dependent receptor n=2 Tax=Sphingomonas parva TaxID=2555898 RepID=A0A4Y8ZYC8_9SPHN|nr:TonB-dependent receptor [Sphingomonas parva]